MSNRVSLGGELTLLQRHVYITEITFSQALVKKILSTGSVTQHERIYIAL